MPNDPASACTCLYLHTQLQSSRCQCQGALRTQIYAVIYQRPSKQNKTKPGQRKNNNLSNCNKVVVSPYPSTVRENLRFVDVNK